MAKAKFKIQVIEEGRLTTKEQNEILGGYLNCYPAYLETCANYTNCLVNQYGVLDKDGTFTLLYLSGQAYSSCSWGGNESAFSISNCNIAGNYNVCKGEIKYN